MSARPEEEKPKCDGPQREFDPERDVHQILRPGTKANDALTGTNDPTFRDMPGKKKWWEIGKP